VQVTIELPDDIGEELRAKWNDLPRHAVEAIALEGYRTSQLSEWQLERVLGIGNRLDVHRLLKKHGAFLEYTPAELQEEIEMGERLLNRVDMEFPPR
jgi:hypothetical protein